MSSRSAASRATGFAAELAVLLALLALDGLAYWPSFGYGFMLDDPLDLPRAGGRSLEYLLTSSEDYGYFRPLTFAVWRVLYLGFGWYNQVGFHLLPLGLHGLNAYLVYRLGRRFLGRRGGAAAATLFVLFPFSYQVAPMVNVTSHALTVFLVLLAVVLYLEWRHGGAWPALLGSVAAALAAPFAHESGVMVGALVALTEVAVVWRDGRRLSPTPLLHLAASALFVAVWLAAPKWSETPLPGGESSLRSLPYVFQALAYPPTAFLGRLGGWPASDGGVVLVSVGTLALLLLFYWRRRNVSAFALALAWAWLAVLPAVVALDFLYVIDSPRLLYLASVGIALLWGGLAQGGDRRGVLGWQAAVAIAIVVGVALLSASFVVERHRLYAMGRDVVRQLVATAVEDPSPEGEGPKLYVNVPSWFAYKELDYAIGHSGVIMVPGYVGLGRVVFMETGVQPRLESLAYADLLRPWNYWYGPHAAMASLERLDDAIRSVESVYLAEIDASRWRLVRAGSLTPATDTAPSPTAVDFGGAYRLLTSEITASDGGLAITLTWQCLRSSAADVTVFVHLLDDSGRVISQADGYPLKGLSPMRLWRAGDRVGDLRHLPLPPSSGGYTAIVGVYDRATEVRLAAIDAVGRRLTADAAVAGTVSLSP